MQKRKAGYLGKNAQHSVRRTAESTEGQSSLRKTHFVGAGLGAVLRVSRLRLRQESHTFHLPRGEESRGDARRGRVRWLAEGVTSHGKQAGVYSESNRKPSVCFKQDAVTPSKVTFWKILSAVERTERGWSLSGWDICTGLG